MNDLFPHGFVISSWDVNSLENVLQRLWLPIDTISGGGRCSDCV